MAGRTRHLKGQAILDDPATSYWLSDALDAEVLAIILAKRADEQAAHALVWMVVQRAQDR